MSKDKKSNSYGGLLLAGVIVYSGLCINSNTQSKQDALPQNEATQNDELNSYEKNIPNDEVSLYEENIPNDKVSSYEENTQNQDEASIKQENTVYHTDSYYVIYLNDNIYITTGKEKKSFHSWGSFIRYTDIEHWDVKTREFVGVNLAKRLANGRIVYSSGMQVNTEHDASYQDDSYNGEFGYGYIIPNYAIFKLSQFMDKKTLNQEEFDFFTSNSDELKKYIRSSIYYNKQKIISGWDSYNFGFLKRSESKTKEALLTKYACTKQNGESDVFLGYRCSYNTNDIGYNMVYDTLTGTIHYIGTKRLNSYVSINEKVLDNSEHTTVQEMRKAYGVDTKSVLETEEKALETEKNPDKKLLKEVENNEPIKFYEENGLYVLDAKSEAVDYGDSDKNYYLLTLDDAIYQDSIYDVYNFSEVNNSNSFAIVSVIDGEFNLNYDDSENDILLTLSGDSSSSILIDVNQFLASNGFNDLIKKNGQYSNTDINTIYQCIEELNNQATLGRK